MSFKAYTSQVAYDLLSCPDFQEMWQDLVDECCWATPYQGINFSKIWFNIYEDSFEPVFLLSEGNDGTLDDLLILGRNKKTNQLVHVGGQQAEYQCWLSRSERFASFIEQALKEAFKIGGGNDITFRFLPPSLLDIMTEASELISTRFSLREDKKPIVKFGVSPAPWEAMRKKGNKSKLSRLRKLGEFSVELLTFSGPSAEGDATNLLKQVVPYYDFRQAAISDCLPFAEDDRKFDFYLALLINSDEFQVLAIQQNNTLVACIIGPVTTYDLSVGVFCFDFFLSKHSPGKLLLLLGAELLANKGLEAIDLTPGGDWKWRYANDTQNVASITFYSRQYLYVKSLLLDRGFELAKRLLIAIGVKPSHFYQIRSFIKKVTVKNISNKLSSFSLVQKEEEYRVYRYSLERARKLCISTQKISCNQIDDFLKYKPSETWQSRKSFIGNCLKRFEAGVFGYSYADNNHLLHSGWLVPFQKKSYFTEVGKEYIYPEAGAVLFDFYTHPSARGQGLYQNALTQMLSDAADLPDINYIYISVLAENKPSRHVIEKIGFEYLTSVYGKG